jgi:hypothetical protein
VAGHGKQNDGHDLKQKGMELATPKRLENKSIKYEWATETKEN